MDFEEKIDAMRMTLELAIHDIDGLRAAMHEVRLQAEADRGKVDELVTATANLLAVAESHERRLGRIESRF